MENIQVGDIFKNVRQNNFWILVVINSTLYQNNDEKDESIVKLISVDGKLFWGIGSVVSDKLNITEFEWNKIVDIKTMGSNQFLKTNVKIIINSNNRK